MSEYTVAGIVKSHLEKNADLDVLTFVDINADGSFSDETRTYQELWDNGQRIAAGLDAEGLEPGQAFGLVMQNHPEFVDAMVGASISGTVFVPIDPRTRGDKLSYMLKYAECRGAIVADYALDNLAAVAGDLDQLQWVWVLDTGIGAALPSGVSARWLGDVLNDPVPNLEIRSTDPMAPMQMLYTSGTTGDPKAILAPHIRFAGVASLGETIGLQSDDRPYTGLSLTHANAQLITLGICVVTGLRGVFSRKFTKSRLWDITREYGCTMFNLLGGMTTAIYSEPVKANDADNPVRYVLSAGMPAAIWDNFQNRFGVEIHEFYGTAEGGLTINPPGVGPIGSIGKPPPNMIGAILDEDDNECPPGVSGEICFRPADDSSMAVEYYKNPEASEKKTARGWFRSGDIGHMDDDGWFYFEYRAGGGIRRNGDFVNPAFVEKAIAEVDCVRDVFVYGVHTDANVAGEKEVVAAIEAEGEFDAAAVFAACVTNLESNFVPTYLQLVDEIPKTASEKPQERFLLEAFDADAANVFTRG